MALPVRRRDAAPQPIRRWDPDRELEGLQEQLVQLMQRTSDDDGGAPFIPLVDIEETEDAWIVEAELPGVKPEDVNVEVRGSELAISGEIKERERDGILRRRTRKPASSTTTSRCRAMPTPRTSRPSCTTGS
jgi:HSP20 family protein